MSALPPSPHETQAGSAIDLISLPSGPILSGGSQHLLGCQENWRHDEGISKSMSL